MHKFETWMFPHHLPELSEVAHAGFDLQGHDPEEFQGVHERSDAVQALLVRADLNQLVCMVYFDAVVKGLVQMGSLEENSVASDP